MPGTEKEWEALTVKLSEKLWSKRPLPHVPNDPVNNPDHYNTGSIECIQAIEASMSPEEFRGYLKGNTMKYLWRYGYKGAAIQDLKKAQWYLTRLSAVMEGTGEGAE